MINVFGAITGTEGDSIEEEGMRSALTPRGYDVPILVLRRSSWRTLVLGGPKVQIWFTCLDVHLRRQLGPPAVMFYDASGSKHASREVEKKTQLLVAAAAAELNIAVAWRRAGQGGGAGEVAVPRRLPAFHYEHG